MSDLGLVGALPYIHLARSWGIVTEMQEQNFEADPNLQTPMLKRGVCTQDKCCASLCVQNGCLTEGHENCQRGWKCREEICGRPAGASFQ